MLLVVTIRTCFLSLSAFPKCVDTAWLGPACSCSCFCTWVRTSVFSSAALPCGGTKKQLKQKSDLLIISTLLYCIYMAPVTISGLNKIAGAGHMH